MFINRTAVALLAIGAALTACAKTQPFATDASVRLAPLSVLPAPDGSAAAGEAVAAYHVGAYDKLRVDVFGVADLTREVQTDAQGDFSFPLLGEVPAGGRTLAEAAKLIEDGLRGRYVKRPEVTINLVEAVSRVVTLDGQVSKPGQYPVLGPMTLVRAVALAGGTSEYAKLDDVVVFRTVATQKYAALYNLGAIRRGNYPDPQIYPNDVVVVGDSAGRRLFKDILQASPLITTPIILLAQRRN